MLRLNLNICHPFIGLVNIGCVGTQLTSRVEVLWSEYTAVLAIVKAALKNFMSMPEIKNSVKLRVPSLFTTWARRWVRRSCEQRPPDLCCVLSRTADSWSPCRTCWRNPQPPACTCHTGPNPRWESQIPQHFSWISPRRRRQCRIPHKDWDDEGGEKKPQLKQTCNAQWKWADVLLPCVQHRSSNAEDSAAASQVGNDFPLNITKRIVDRVKHARYKEISQLRKQNKSTTQKTTKSHVTLPAMWGVVGYCSRRIFGFSNTSTCWRQLSNSFSFITNTCGV